VKRVLVIQLYRIGDVLQTFPVFRGLRQAHPGARLDLLTDGLLPDIGALCPDIDRVLCFPRHALRVLMKEQGDHAQALYLAAAAVERLRAERYDLVLNLHQDVLGKRLAGALDVERTLGQVQPTKGPLVLAGGGIERFVISVSKRRTSRRNFVDHMLDIAGLPFGVRGRVRLPAGARLRAQELLDSRLPGGEDLVVVQSGTSRAFRGLAPEWIEAVQKRLPHARYAWLGSAGERAGIEARLRSGLKGACFAGDTSLPEAAAIIARSRLVLTGDTAALHLAALLSVPTVSAFFGTAQPFETGPYGGGHACVFEPPECAPCNLMDGCEEPRCKTAVSGDLLAGACAAALEGKPQPPGVWVSALGPQGLSWLKVGAPALAAVAA
jgi:ADP-heptose:LPS heptosyltransferase